MIDDSWYQPIANLPTRLGAGGVVATLRGNQVYLAFAREHELDGFVIAKGGVEGKEGLERAARREVREELGIKRLRLVCKLGARERLSYRKTYWQITHYFLFAVPSANISLRDPAASAFWFPLRHLPPLLWQDQAELITEHREVIERRIRALARKSASQDLHD